MLPVASLSMFALNPNSFQPDVVELRVPMTSMMVKLQTAVLDLILFTIKELKRINVSVSEKTK